MKQELERVLEEVRSAWRFRWLALAAASIASVIGWSIVFTLPDRYAADARVFVDTRTALKPALQGLTTDQNIDAQINYVRQSLLEGPQLEKIAKETGVLPVPVTDERVRTRILNTLSDGIALTVFSAGSQGDERRLTLPASLREKYRLGEGDPLTLVDLDGAVLLSPRLLVVPRLAAEMERLRRARKLSLKDLGGPARED